MFFDVVEAGCAVIFAENYPPTGGNRSEGRPKTVLFFVIDQDEKTAAVIIEWIDLQLMDPLTPDNKAHHTDRNVKDLAVVQN